MKEIRNNRKNGSESPNKVYRVAPSLRVESYSVLSVEPCNRSVARRPNQPDVSLVIKGHRLRQCHLFHWVVSNQPPLRSKSGLDSNASRHNTHVIDYDEITA